MVFAVFMITILAGTSVGEAFIVPPPVVAGKSLGVLPNSHAAVSQKKLSRATAGMSETTRLEMSGSNNSSGSSRAGFLRQGAARYVCTYIYAHVPVFRLPPHIFGPDRRSKVGWAQGEESFCGTPAALPPAPIHVRLEEIEKK